MVKMGYVWDRTVEFLGDHASQLLPVVILALFVPTSIAGALEPLRESADQGLKLVLGLVSIAFGVLSLWAQLAIAALAVDPAIGRRMTAAATARLLPAIGIYLLLLAVVLVLCIPIGMLAVMAGVDVAAISAGQTPGPASAPGYLAIALIYGLVLGVAALFVFARLMPLSAVIVAERRGVGALGRSWSLTRGLTWRLVGVVVLYVVVATVATLAAQTVFGTVLKLVAGGEGTLTVANVITAVVVAAVSTGFSVLAAAFGGKLYAAILRSAEPAAVPAGV